MAPSCASAANCHPFFSWVVFFPGHMKASVVWHNGGVVVHVKDGKYVSPKENVNFKRQGWNFVVDSSPEDRCFQLVCKKTHKMSNYSLNFSDDEQCDESTYRT